MSTSSIQSSLQAGPATTTFGERYSLEKEIGRSQAASLYRAVEVETGRPVAVKIFQRRYSIDPRFVIRFREHLKTLQTIEHECLASVLDYGVIQGRYYIAAEWLGWPDLAAYLAEHGPLTVPQAIGIASQVCSALEAIHHSGLLHSNLKPQNILLSAGGGVKVTDTGLSNLISASGLTRTHVMVGRFHYIAPEQVRGQAAGPGSDLYSLGVLLFEMLTNRPPFESRDAWEVLHMHVDASPLSPDQINPNVPPDLAAIVLRALQKDPSKRFSSAVEMNVFLAALLAGKAMHPIEAFHPPDHHSRPWMNGNWLNAVFRKVTNFLISPVPLGILGLQLPFVLLLFIQLLISFAFAFALFYLLTI